MGLWTNTTQALGSEDIGDSAKQIVTINPDQEFSRGI